MDENPPTDTPPSAAPPPPPATTPLSGGGMKVIQPTSGDPVPKPIAPLPEAAPEHPAVVSSTSPTAPTASTPYTPAAASVGEFDHSAITGVKPSRHLPAWVVVSTVFVVVLAVAAAAYFLILPKHWADNYTSAIKPLYAKQAADMSTVYSSTNRAVFSSSTQGPAANTTDLNYITSTIKAATKSTNALKAADHLTILPGTGGQQAVKAANKQYQAMQQYVSDSQAFLADYTTLDTYTQKINALGVSPLPTILSDFNTIIGSGGNTTTFLAAAQQTSTDLQNFTNQVKLLKPSADLEQFNSDLLTDLTGLNNSLQSISSAIQGNGSINIINTLGELATSVTNFVELVNSNPTANLTTTSILHGQIVTLQAEKPLS